MTDLRSSAQYSLEATAMVEELLGAGRYGVLAVVAVILVLGVLAFVALTRCDKADIPKIVESLSAWWRRRS